MNIKFLNAKRTSFHQVEVTYSLDDIEFTVAWNNIHPGTGEIGDYDLDVFVECEDEDVKYRVEDAIRGGTDDDNEDFELYLFVRDEFNAHECEEYDTPVFKCVDFTRESRSFQYEILVTNECGETESFKINYQLEKHNNEVTTASIDAHDSEKLLKFCDGNTLVLDALNKEASELVQSIYENK